MDFRGGVGVSRLRSSHEVIEFSSSEQLGDGDPALEAPEEAATPFSLCFFFRFFLCGFPAEVTREVVNIDRLYVFLTGVREEDRVRMIVVGQLSFSMQTTGWRWRVVFWRAREAGRGGSSAVPAADCGGCGVALFR